MSFRKNLTESVQSKNFSFVLVTILVVIIGLWLANFLGIALPVDVTTRQSSGELAVIGEGKVDVVPDTASVDLGIVVNGADTVEAAQNEMNTINNAIVAAVTGLGVEKDGIKTSNYSIYPNYDYQNNPNGDLIGYNGNATVTVKVKDTSLLPQVITAATGAGANQVMGTSYSVDNPEVYREQARDKAIENAKEQAKKLAGELGIRLGKVVNMVESTNNQGPILPMYERSYADGLGGNAVTPDLQPGSQNITSTVTLYFDKR